MASGWFQLLVAPNTGLTLPLVQIRTGTVWWSGGTYHPYVQSYADGPLGEADLWYATGVFDVNGGGALAPIVVDSDGGESGLPPPTGTVYVLLKSDASFDTNIDPSFNAAIWAIDKITMNDMVIQWNLRAL